MQCQTNSVGYSVRLLTLPNGQVLLGNGNSNGLLTHSNQLYVYTPDGERIDLETDDHECGCQRRHYTLTGTQLNGSLPARAMAAALRWQPTTRSSN